MASTINDLLNNYITKEEFFEIKSLIKFKKSEGISDSKLAIAIGISDTSVKSLIKEEEEKDQKKFGGIRVSYEEVIIPCLKYIFENANNFTNYHNKNNSIIKRCLDESDESKFSSDDLHFMQNYLGIGNASPEYLPDHFHGHYFGYRLSNQNKSGEFEKIVRFYMKIHKEKGSRISRFHNIYNGKTMGLRHARGHILYVRNRAYLAGVSVGTGHHPDIKFRKSFLLESAELGNRSLRGVVSTISRSKEQIICRTILVPIELHRNVDNVRIVSSDEKSEIEFDWIHKDNIKNKNAIDFTGSVNLKDVLTCLPEEFLRNDIDETDKRNLFEKIIDNKLTDDEYVFKVMPEVL